MPYIFQTTEQTTQEKNHLSLSLVPSPCMPVSCRADIKNWLMSFKAASVTFYPHSSLISSYWLLCNPHNMYIRRDSHGLQMDFYHQGSYTICLRSWGCCITTTTNDNLLFIFHQLWTNTVVQNKIFWQLKNRLRWNLFWILMVPRGSFRITLVPDLPVLQH